MLVSSASAERAERHGMAGDFQEEMLRPVTLTAGALALVGWLLFIWILTSTVSTKSDQQSRIADLERQTASLDTSLKRQETASGLLADVDSKRLNAETALASAKAAATASLKARDDALAQLTSAKEALAELVRQREATEKAAAVATTDRDRITAENTSLQQSADALKQDAAQLADLIAGRKAEGAALDKQAADLRTSVDELTIQRDQLNRALTEATAERDRLNEEALATRQATDAVRQQETQAKDDLTAAQTELTALQTELAARKTESARLESEIAAGHQAAENWRQQGGQANEDLLKTRTQLLSLGSQVKDAQATIDLSAAARRQLTAAQAELEATLGQKKVADRAVADAEVALRTDRDALEQVKGESLSLAAILKKQLARREQADADMARQTSASADLQVHLAQLDEQMQQRARDLADLETRLNKARGEAAAPQTNAPPAAPSDGIGGQAGSAP